MTKRAVIYCRVSTTGQEENSSLSTQEEQCRRYAAGRGWELAGIFRDVHTGSELFERPGLTALREGVRQGEANVVVSHALDRVSRNQAHLGFLLSEWDHVGAQLELVTEDLSNTPEGKLLQSVRSFVAEVERLKIAERSKRGVRARVDSGKPMPGQKAPFGYHWADEKKSKLVFDPVTAPIARRLFRGMLEGQTLRGMSMSLTAEGIPTATGKSPQWRPTTIRTILMNPIYAGRAFAFRTKQERRKGSVRTTVNPKADWIPLPDGIAPPLVTPEQFDAVQARLAYNQATAPRNNANPEAALLRCGAARCGYCGYPLSVTKRRGSAHLYRCHRVNTTLHNCPSFGVMAAILDAAVWQKVEAVLRQPEIIAREVERRRTTNVLEADLTAIDRRISDIAAQQARLAKAVAAIDDEATIQPLLNEMQSLSGSANVLKSERRGIEDRRNQEAEIKHRLLMLSDWCSRVAGNLPVLTYHEKRMVLDALGVSVRVFRADHEPRWEITMAPLPVEPAQEGSIVFSTPTPFTTAMWRSTARRSTG